MMATPSFTLNKPSNEKSNAPDRVFINSDKVLLQTLDHQENAAYGPLAILWDIENCPVPSDVCPEDVSGNIRMALRAHPATRGAITMFSAYGDFNAFPRRLREGCQRTGVKLVDVPNGRKDAADKAILVDMFLFALDNQPPSSILLISGDVDFSSALHILGQRGYTIILVIPSGIGVSYALSSSGKLVWDWPSIARGKGFVRPRSYVPRGPDLSSHLMSYNIGESSNCNFEEEAIVYSGHSQQIGFSSRDNISSWSCDNPKYVYNQPNIWANQYRSNNTTVLSLTPTRSQSLPPVGDQNGSEDPPCVSPEDILRLRVCFVRLLLMFGGSLPLKRIPPEYLKAFGQPLSMAEYGVRKVVHLINKMRDTFIVSGKGAKKTVFLRNPEECPGTEDTPKEIGEEQHISEENSCVTAVGIDGLLSDGTNGALTCSKDRCTDDTLLATEEYDLRLVVLKQEVQELLLCHSCVIPLSSFTAFYERRYKKAVDFQGLGGVDGIEGLVEKMRDVVELYEDPCSKNKLLFPADE